ncbi:MAG: DUF58 domain-containing protein [Chitinispirillaceae bacterium]|nr:DUF58 domain-containing protein [Chitinispirillaceae bacterium]
MAVSSFLKPEHIAPIRNLNLQAKLIVEGLLAGLHRSPFHGFSSEFSEYRAYRDGEPIKFIDWRKYAKTERSYVRLYEDETNCIAHILIDKSASMGFSGKGVMSKFDYARALAASITWILIRQRDAVALAVFDEEITTYLPPHSTNLQLKNIISTLENLKPAEKTRCGSAIERLANRIKKRGMTVIISDLFDEPEEIIRGLRHLRFKKQDISLIWLIDPLEQNFSSERNYKLQDLETSQDIFLDGHTASLYLQEGIIKHRRLIEESCRELKIDFSIIETNEPFVKGLIRILHTREKLL